MLQGLSSSDVSKGGAIWGAVAVVLGFGVIFGGGSVTGGNIWLLIAGSCIGIFGALWMLRVISQSSAIVNRAEALNAAFERDARALRLVDAEGQTLMVNAEGRRFWGQIDPMLSLETRLFDDEIDQETFRRFAGAYDAGLDDVQELSLQTIGRDISHWGSSDRDWVQVEVQALRHPIGARLLAAKDISARRAMENVLKGESEYLSDFLDFLPVGVYALDAEQNFRFVNQTFADWLGLAVEDLQGQPLASVLAKGSGVPEMDGAWVGLVRLQSVKAGVFPALISHSLYDENGETLTRAVVMRDAVQSGQVEGNAAELGPFGRQVFDEAPVGIAVLDVDGLPRPMLAEANEALASMLGRARDDLMGMTVEEMVDPSMREEVSSVLERAAKGKAVAPLEVRLDSERDLTAMLHIRTL